MHMHPFTIFFFFQFHPDWLQFVQKVLDSAGLLSEPTAVLRQILLDDFPQGKTS